MDYIRAQWARLGELFSQLSSSQRMLAASLIAVMVMTVLFWGRYAAAPVMEPLLGQTFAPAEVSNVVALLGERGIKAQQGSEGRVLVSADRQQDAYAVLAYNRVMPKDTSAAVEKLMAQLSPFDPASKTDRIWNERKALVLAQTLRQFPGVDDAAVYLDPAERRSLSSSPVLPTASVNVRMKNGDRPSSKLVMAIADTVAGAQGGLSRSRVNVVIDGVSFPIQDREMDAMLGGGEILEQKGAWENFYRAKVLSQLAFINNPFVSVSVELNTKRMEEVRDGVDPKNYLHKELETKSKTDETTSTAPPSGDVGTVPNVGLSLPGSGGGGGGTSTTSTEETTKFQLIPGKNWTRTNTPPGDAAVVAATVRVPRSHFVAVYKSMNPKATDPDEATLAPLIALELGKIRADVKACTALKNDADVNVDYYGDVALAPAEAGSAKVFPVTTVMGMGKEIAVGVLAVASLAMVSLMVKKSGPAVLASAAAAASAARNAENERLDTGEELVGAASEGAQTLDGVELDPETSKTEQMVEQVSNMVKSNPDGAAQLVKRWMIRT